MKLILNFFMVTSSIGIRLLNYDVMQICCNILFHGNKLFAIATSIRHTFTLLHFYANFGSSHFKKMGGKVLRKNPLTIKNVIKTMEKCQYLFYIFSQIVNGVEKISLHIFQYFIAT